MTATVHSILRGEICFSLFSFRKRAPLLPYIEFKYHAVFLPVPVAGIRFGYHSTHALIEPHGIFIVRAAIAGKTADSVFPAVIFQNNEGLFPDSFVLIFLQHIQRMQPYPGAGMLENEISDILVTVFNQIYREGRIGDLFQIALLMPVIVEIVNGRIRVNAPIRRIPDPLPVRTDGGCVTRFCGDKIYIHFKSPIR